MPANFAVSVSIKAIDEVTRTLNRITHNISGHGEKIKKLGENVNEVATPKSISNSFSVLQSEWSSLFHLTETQVFFRKMEEGAGRVTKGFQALGGAVKESMRGLTAAGFAMGGIGFLSSRMFSDLSKTNVELKHSAQNLGISPQALRSYRFASESVGVPGVQIDAALQRVNEMGFELRAGNPSAATPLTGLPGGVRLLDRDGMQRGPLEVLREIADKINTPGISSITKSQLLSSIFGSADLLPFLNLGSQGIQKRINSYSSGSYEKSDEASKRYLQASSQFKASLEHLGRIASIEILPGVAKGLERISEWISAHGDQLKSLFQEIGISIPKEMSRALWFLNSFAMGLAFISKHIGLANLVFITFSGIIGGRVLTALWNFVLAFKSFGLIPVLLNALLSPIKLVTTALATLWAEFSLPIAISFIGPLLGAMALVAGSVVLVTRYKKEIIELTGQVGEFFKKILTKFSDWTTSILKPFMDWIESLFSLSGKKIEMPVLHLKAETQTDIFQNKTEKSGFLDQILQSSSSRKNMDNSKQTAEVTIKFDNLPKGARVEEKKGDIPINLSAGYMTAGGFI